TAALPRPRIFVAEWIDPPFCGGHWVPEMVEAAGGEDVLAVHGEPSFPTTWEDVIAAEPELVVIAPCASAPCCRAQPRSSPSSVWPTR
ncbi:MAG: hypothetical protein ACJ77M_02055, partial [Thermoleophilaceae bacterium]